MEEVDFHVESDRNGGLFVAATVNTSVRGYARSLCFAHEHIFSENERDEAVALMGKMECAEIGVDHFETSEHWCAVGRRRADMCYEEYADEFASGKVDEAGRTRL